MVSVGKTGGNVQDSQHFDSFFNLIRITDRFVWLLLSAEGKETVRARAPTVWWMPVHWCKFPHHLRKTEHWHANSVVCEDILASAPTAFITTFQWNQFDGQLLVWELCTLSVTIGGGVVWWCELESRQSKTLFTCFQQSHITSFHGRIYHTVLYSVYINENLHRTLGPCKSQSLNVKYLPNTEGNVCLFSC